MKNNIRMRNAECGMRNFVGGFLLFALCLCVSAVNISAQEPKPGPVRSVNIPAVKDVALENGLTVAVIEKRNVPLVTVQFLVRAGASNEGMAKAGLADMTASLLTLGTKTRTAEQIANEIEFLGGSINSGADWNSSFVNITVTSDKLDQAMAILADVVLNPTFPQDELDLLRSQAIDGLTYNLTQPGFLGNYVASKYSYGEHPAGGTPESLAGITAKDVTGFYTRYFKGNECVLIFTGDVDSEKAVKVAQEMFGELPAGRKMLPGPAMSSPEKIKEARPTFARMLVVDLAGSGQASVSYRYALDDVGRRTNEYHVGSIFNSVLGGGYSSRLNQEIRIKRGLSYGAGSSFAWRGGGSNFGTRTQTKNESAGEVATLLVDELEKIAKTDVAADELVPRKAVLIGSFGRNLETTAGLAAAVSELYLFKLPPDSLNYYTPSINNVTPKQIKDFAGDYLLGGDIIIVGDYAKFKDDLAKRFPDTKFDVIKADELDITKPNLRK